MPCRTQVQPAASFLVCSLIFIEYKKLLDTIGTDTFTALSFEDLEQVSGGGMIWLVDDNHWSWPYEYSIATSQKTMLERATGYYYGIRN